MQAPPPIFDHVYPTMDRIYEDFINILGPDARSEVRFIIFEHQRARIPKSFGSTLPLANQRPRAF